MSNILSFIRRDARHLLSNVISLVVIVGIIVVPTFYAWFNIAAMWDPYGNTKNLKVAVANSDTGYKSDLMPLEVNVGERVVSDLRGSDSINYVVTDEDDALEGVRSGAYYAALVIPESFSSDMMTILSANPTHPQVIFYQNEKANAIAGIVTDKASTTVQRDIDESFASSVTSVGAGVLDQLGTYLDGDEMTQVASRLDTAVSDAQETISGTSRSVRSFSALLHARRRRLHPRHGERREDPGRRPRRRHLLHQRHTQPKLLELGVGLRRHRQRIRRGRRPDRQARERPYQGERRLREGRRGPAADAFGPTCRNRHAL